MALWRPDAPPSHDGAGLAEWSRQCLGRHGADLAFLGDAGTAFVAAGQSELHGHITLWDTLLPPQAACVEQVRGTALF